ncbi:MAG: tetratricopeptide repeat protein [Ferruginibacter sp.]
MNRYLILLGFLFLQLHVIAQKNKADSLEKLLHKEKIDSNKVTLLWRIADISSIYDPESALKRSTEALFLARKIKFVEGQSRALGITANIFVRLGNYPRALEFNLKKLQLEEKRHRPRNLASVLMSIAVVYVYQEEYHQALKYYYKSDSVIQENKIQEFYFNISLNLGDVYDRLNITDSAYNYFKRSLGIARDLKNDDLIGASMIGMGHSYLKQEKYFYALENYQGAITHLQTANDDDLICEAALGLATLYQELNNNDSTVYYANVSRVIAERDGFLPRHLDAVRFLSEHYKQQKNVDSAFYYLNYVKVLNDSINSKSRIRESQILSSNEQLRQLEMEENKKMAQRERAQQLQLLFIGIFIPGFFLVTLLLSRIKIHIRVVKVLGIISLLILFEYLTLLLHPYVSAVTNHTPVYEMFIFVSIAAILIPAHHRIEHWLIVRLTGNRPINPNKIRLKTMRLKKNSN